MTSRRHGRIGCFTLAAGLAAVTVLGCSPSPKSASSDPAPSAPPVSWDGVYRGTIQITGIGSSIDRRWCETDPQMTVQVAAGKFSYAMPHPNAPDNPLRSIRPPSRPTVLFEVTSAAA